MESTQTNRMTPWQQFYNDIKDPSWPDCATESDLATLPEHIMKEITHVHGYKIGDFKKQSRLLNKRFPIVTDTACQLKWNWSTIFLAVGTTASCHRTNIHTFDIDQFNFHNTPEKLHDRKRMLEGQWPEKGCEYCRDIEKAQGQSDRMTNLDLAGMHAPPELEYDANAVRVTPRILEIYFNNTCNLKCVYCGPYFSSLWDAENKKNGFFRKNGLAIPDNFEKRNDIELQKHKLFDWLIQNRNALTNFNILGGEPLFQSEFDECLQFFDRYPAPDLDLQIFSNLNATQQKVDSMIQKIKILIDEGKLRQFTVTASLDCWGPEAEYARFPLDLRIWQCNFERILAEPWIRLIVGSTITPLTVKTLPDLISRIQHWRQTREVYHYFNSVNTYTHMFIDIFGGIFREDFDRALDLMPTQTKEQQQVRQYLEGIAKQSCGGEPNTKEILKLYTYLEELDRRRHTNWRSVYPWLVPVFGEFLNQVDQ